MHLFLAHTRSNMVTVCIWCCVEVQSLAGAILTKWMAVFREGQSSGMCMYVTPEATVIVVYWTLIGLMCSLHM